MIPAITLVFVLILGIKAKINRKSITNIYWMADRIAVFSFILGCLIVSLDLWHGFEHLSMAKGEAVLNLASLEISQTSSKFAYTCGVTLLAILISVIFKLTDKEISNKKNSPDSATAAQEI